jgi:hypothetical protein
MDIAQEQVPVKRGRGRPRKNPAVSADGANTRPSSRVPISGQRDPLVIEGKDPSFYYRWVKDTAENGNNILRHNRAGYTFVTNEEGLVVGEANVYKSENVGTCIRVPAGFGEYLYLMKQPMTYRHEDVQAKSREIDSTEEALRHAGKDGENYGNIRIER